MSCVRILAADHPMPLFEPEEQRVRMVRGPGRQTITVTEDGFSVQPHSYYRKAVDDLGLPIKPFQYELNLRDTEHDLRHLRAYLRQHCRPGEAVELWNIWVGQDSLEFCRFHGSLAELDLDTLRQLEEYTANQQTCMVCEL